MKPTPEEFALGWPHGRPDDPPDFGRGLLCGSSAAALKKAGLDVPGVRVRMKPKDGGEPWRGFVKNFGRYGVNVTVDDADFERATAGVHPVTRVRIMTDGVFYEFPEDSDRVWAEEGPATA